MSALQPIDRSSLDPIALDLGLAAGVLSPSGTDLVTVNQGWFNDPLTNAAKGLRTNGQDLAALLGAIFGELEGNALSIPARDPSGLGTWYPIGKPGAKSGDPPTGLYIVTYAQGAEQIFGLGVKHVWDFGGEGADAKLEVAAWGILPILRAGPKEANDIGAMLVLGSKDNPMMLGISATSPGGPIIDGAGLSLGGGRLSVQISFDKDNPVTVTLEILQLQLPDETKPSDRSLADLQNITGQELLSTIAALLVTALTKVTGDDARTKFLMPLFGLTNSAPGVSGVELPILQWFSLATNAKDDLAKPFRDWFNALASDPAKLKAWLACVSGLLAAPGSAVTGSGTRDDPFAAPIVALGTAGALSFTMASLVNSSGARVVFPGLTVASTNFVIASSEVAVVLRAALEMFQFTLSAPNGKANGAAKFDLRFDADMRLVNTKADTALFTGGGYSIGYLTAGLELTGDLAVIPSFLLVAVETPNGKFATLDLTAPSTLADVAENVLIAAIDTALQKLLGVDPSSPQPVPFASNVAALVGFIPPTNLPNGVTWPTKQLPPPFAAAQLASSLKNPIAALGSYWSQLLQPGLQVGGKTPFFYMLGELAGLMQAAAAQKTPVAVTGDGTPASPWLAAISTDVLPAFVSAYVEPGAAGALQLTTGLRVGPSITVGGTTIAFAVDLNIVALNFPPGQPATAAQWLPRIGAALSLPNGGTTPTVLGAAFKISAAAISAGWSHSAGWGWSILARQPAVVIDGTDIPLGQDLNFSDPAALRKLVTDSGAIFAPVLLGALGIALSRTGTRAGIAATALFGLLPNLKGKLPDGLEWPADMPRLMITALDNPLPDLTKQLAGLVATTDHAKAALTLLAWAMTPSSNTPPVLAGSGTAEDPFQIPLAGLDPLNLSAWIDPSLSGLGFGLIYPQSVTIQQIKLATTTRLDVAELSFAGSTASFAPLGPSLALALAASNTSGPLVKKDDLGVVVQSANFTVTLTLTADGSPNATWKISLPSQTAVRQIAYTNVSATSDPGDQTYENLALALAFEAVSTGFGSNATFKTVYGLLTAAGLAVPATNGTGYGLNVGGWRSFVADPTGYLASRTLELLADPPNRDALFNIVWQLVGLPRFSVPVPVLVTLQALGVVRGPDEGYAIVPSAVMALARSPFATLAARFNQLTQDDAALRALIGQFGQSRICLDFWFLRFEVANSTRVSLAPVPGKSFAIGNVLEVTGSIAFDLQTFALSASVPVRLTEIGLAIAPALTLQQSAPHVMAVEAVTPTFAIGIAWGTGDRTVAAPLPVYPFSPPAFLDALANVAPQYVLSAFVTGLLQSQLLANYPLAQGFFKGLGVAFTDKDGQLQMPSLLGLLNDPIGWFRASGLFELRTLQSVLTALPDTSIAGSLALQSIPNGKRVAGLPYGLQIDLAVDLAANMATLTPNLGAPLQIAKGVATLQTLSLGLGVDTTFQPSISGQLRVGGVVPTNNKIFVALAYDKAFTLAIGEDATNGATLQLVPFPSWTTLVQTILKKAEQAVLAEVTNLLLDELAKQPSLKTFVANLRQSATDLAVPDLVNAIINAQPDPAKIEAAALAWLRDRISDANVNKTSTSIATLLGSIVPDFSSTGGLVTYAPRGKLPITISAGLATVGGNKVLGLWADLDYVAAKILQITVTRTGVAIPTSGPVTPTVTFDAGLCALIEGTTGPTLTFEYDSGTGALSLMLDPLGDDSNLARELAPKLFGFPPGELPPDAISKWLLQVLLYVVPRYVVDAVLMVDTVDEWMHRGIVPKKDNGNTTYVGPKPGEVLSGAQLLVTVEEPKERYVLNSLDKLQKLTIAQFLSGFFIALLKNELQLLTIDKGGIWIAKPKQVGSSTAYGLRVALPDINIPGLDNVVFQLGATDTGWIKEAGGDTDTLEPGVSFLVPIDKDKGPDFKTSVIDIINVGVDIVGAKGKPLIDLSRFQLGSIKPRGVVELTFGQGSLVPIFGGALDVNQIALSLAPNTVTGGGNQVAQNLLGSGTDEKQKNPPTNPGFSFLAGYLQQPSGGKLAVELMGPDGKSQTKVWIPVQRSFGPLHVNQVGLGWLKPTYHALVLFDGSLALFGFEAAVQDLEVGIPVTDITNYEKYTLDLGGLEISFKGGSLTIAGGLLKEGDGDNISYAGAASVQAGQYGLTAFGSYAMIETSGGKKAPSLFVFAALEAPIGGPPAFFIMGAAGGFAYNRDLIVPAIGDVVEFPFIKGARDPSYFAGADPSKALKSLGEAAPPKVGAYWAAAGLFFTTFKLLDTFALAMMQFGSEFAINVLGVSTITQPPEVKRDEALVYLELAMKLSLRPSDGVFSMEAQLTPNSFVLIKACKVTGGFAFYLWFKDDKAKKISAGDFVLTVGGYSPRFTKPDFYPPVPILGINWPVADGVNVRGGAYLALTPSAFMVGGFLNATFEAGPLQAWFNASADVLVAWQPFYFIANIDISVGVAFDISVGDVHMRLSASLGASLLLEGPPVHGQVHVSWYVISFTIPFGKGPDPDDKTLTWPDFEKAFLPPPQQPKQQPAGATLAADPPPPLQQVVKATSQIGLLSKTTDAHGEDWTIGAAPLSIRVDSAIPMTLATVTSGPAFTGVDIGAPPVGMTAIKTPVELTLKYEVSSGNYQPVPSLKGLTFTDSRAGAPDAMWSKSPFDPEGAPSAKVIPNALTSMVMAGDEYVVGSEIGPIDLLKAFAFSDAANLPLAYDQMPVYVPASPMQQGTFEQIMARIGSTIMSTESSNNIVAKRNAMFAALTDAGIYTPQDPDLSVMARFAGSLFQAPPIMAKLSETLSGGISEAAFGRVTPGQRSHAIASEPSPVSGPDEQDLRQLGSLSRYRRAASRPRADGVAATAAASAARPAQIYVNVATSPARAAADAPGNERSIRLRDGGYALWQVPHRTPAQIAARDGAPIRVVTFDAYTDLLDDRILPAGEAATLPEGTAVLAVQHAAHLAEDAGQLVGWTPHSELLQANRARFVGDGFTVKPHGDPRWLRRGRMQRHGIMDGATMLRRNRTRRGPGWVETTFPAAMRSLVLTVRGGTGAAAAAIDVQLRTADEDAPYNKLSPAATIAAGRETLLVYDLPAASEDGHHHVLVRCEEGWILDGCHAWRGRAADFENALPGLQPLIGGMVIGTEPTEAIAVLSAASPSNRTQADVP